MAPLLFCPYFYFFFGKRLLAYKLFFLGALLSATFTFPRPSSFYPSPKLGGYLTCYLVYLGEHMLGFFLFFVFLKKKGQPIECRNKIECLFCLECSYWPVAFFTTLFDWFWYWYECTCRSFECLVKCVLFEMHLIMHICCLCLDTFWIIFLILV